MSDARSDDARAYRALYDTAAWRRIRAWVLRREPLCRYCRKQGRVTPATVVDHIEAHRGDTSRFFDPDNLQSLCKTCHDGAKQSHERTGHARGCDAHGMPLDETSQWRRRDGGSDPHE